MILNKRVVVMVKNGETPVKNAKVTLYAAGGSEIFSAVTDYEGAAYLFYNVTDKADDKPLTIKVTSGEKTVIVNDFFDVADETDEQTSAAGETDTANNVKKEDILKLDINLEAANPAVKLELMLMVDTTGSMSDELSFLQAELSDVVKTVKSELQISVDISVNFYRDTEDAYIVRDFPFTSDIEQVQKDLNKQYSDGGGDYPEAVHTALINAVKEHQWSNDTVKLLFLVLDAPPHSESQVVSTLYPTIKEAAAKGIRIIPIASSGVDLSTEVFLRTAANLTGGTYVFLTDDSGVGGSHLEASVGDYEVEKLNDLMVRLIKEYCS